MWSHKHRLLGKALTSLVLLVFRYFCVMHMCDSCMPRSNQKQWEVLLRLVCSSSSELWVGCHLITIDGVDTHLLA